MNTINQNRSLQQLTDENALLYEEVMVSRKASSITAKLVVKQFEKMEQILSQLEDKVDIEQQLRSELFNKLREVEAQKQELDIARNVAEAANKAKSVFIASTSHELRTPLTSILGFAKIIQKRLNKAILPLTPNDDPKVARAIRQVTENIDIIISEGERLTKLINNVLDLAKIEAGKIEWNMQQISLYDVINQSITATQSLFNDNSDLELKTNFERNLPDIIGDYDRLMQVIINLISNSVKFTEKGSITCELKQDNDKILVNVIDTGIGISKEDQNNVFEKFIQVGDVLTDKPSGTGLGLAICKQIIEYHGGKIWVESQKDHGSTFTFMLPITSVPQLKVDKKVGLAHKTTDLEEVLKVFKIEIYSIDSLSARQEKILVVDDEDHIRELIKQDFESAGYCVITAKNGSDAIAIAKESNPDLILLDIMMPKINGFDVIEILKNDPIAQKIPIVILSGISNKNKGYHLGAESYFTKPVNSESLIKEIKSILSRIDKIETVFVVDSNMLRAEKLYNVIKEAGYIVDKCFNINECFEKIEVKLPDIIVIDEEFSKQHNILAKLQQIKKIEHVRYLVLGKEISD